jgi:type II secretory pathway pseudopilin PulG
MKTLNPNRRRPQPAEEGFTLIAVIFLVAILVIAMAVAAPSIRKDIQRDRDVETMHRGKQYRRAIKLYYKKFNAYPPTVEALVNTNNIRFLRKKYIDPTTGKDEWKMIRFGQNKVPTAWGFFGVPLNGTTIAGTGPNGGGTGLSGTASGGGSSGGSYGAFGAFGSGGSSSGSAGAGSPSGSPGAGTNTNGSSGTPGTPGGTGSTDPNAPGGTGSTGTGLTGQTFGGGGIIGFSPNSPKQSILVVHKKNHYNEWEFVYDPLAEQMMMQGGAGLTGQPNGSPTTPGGTTSPFGGTSAPFGGSTPGSGPTSSPGTMPPPPSSP